MSSWLTDWLIDLMTDWLTDWMTGYIKTLFWLTNWLKATRCSQRGVTLNNNTPQYFPQQQLRVKHKPIKYLRRCLPEHEYESVPFPIFLLPGQVWVDHGNASEGSQIVGNTRRICSRFTEDHYFFAALKLPEPTASERAMPSWFLLWTQLLIPLLSIFIQFVWVKTYGFW